MQAHERVSAAIKAANDAGRTALVPFITAGYPERERFTETLISVAKVGDVVEVTSLVNARNTRGEGDERIGRWMDAYRTGIEKLQAFAEARGYSAADAAIAWVAAHPAVTSPLVGESGRSS